MKSLFVLSLLAGSGVANAYFQPDDLMPSPRYVANNVVTFTTSNFEIRHLELNWFDGRVNAPTGGATLTPSYTNNEFGINIFNGVFGQTFNGHDNGQISIHDIGAGVYNLEFLSMFLNTGPYLVRESPTLPSIGQSTLTPSGGGYNMTSFFDVFVELSLDGGSTWIPSTNAVHLVGETPEPGSFLAILAGVAGLCAVGRKKA